MGETFSVIKGAEAFYLAGNEVGILLSHGFMGTPQSVEYLGKSLAKLGYTVYAPRLAGHGTNQRELETCTASDWFASLEEGYRLLKKSCKVIYVIGQSMGGALALQLGKQEPSIAGIITINAALSVPAYETYEDARSPRWIAEDEPDIKKQDVYEITYDQVPLTAIHQLQQVMTQTKHILPDITVPVLAFKSVDDHVVPASNTDFLIDQVSSVIKKKISLLHSYHVASMDFDQLEIVEQTHRFISNLSIAGKNHFIRERASIESY